MQRHTRQRNRDRGVALVLMLMMLGIFASLATAMAMVAQTNLRSAATHRHAQQAMVAAEAGVTFAMHRLNAIAQEQAHWSDKGLIAGEEAVNRWAAIRDDFVARLKTEPHYVEGNGPYRLRLGDGDGDGAHEFELSVEQHPLASPHDYGSPFYARHPYNVDDGSNRFTGDGLAVTPDNPVDERWVRLAVTGHAGGVERRVAMDFKLHKTARYAILSRNRIMIGRNVIIDGPVASQYTQVDEPHGHPIQMRDNFHGLTASLDQSLNDLAGDLGSHDVDGDNRLAVNDEETAHLSEAERAAQDRNDDGFIDTYDKLLAEFDADADAVISESEFSSGGDMLDEQLWRLINEAKYPAGTKFYWSTKQVLLPGETTPIDASGDLGVIDGDDAYAKVHGEVKLKATKEAWEAGEAIEADGDYQDWLRGPIKADPFEPPTTFGDQTMAEFTADSFDVSAYRNEATGAFAEQVNNAEPADESAAPTYIPPSDATRESVPYQAQYPYDHYDRPVYENYVFRDVAIPKGTNAVFKNCRFIGVTFVETEVDNADPDFNYAGMQREDGELTYAGVEAEVNGQPLTDTKPVSNNLRFHDCQFQGVVASDVPEAFSHTRNKLQFTGDTEFDIDAPGLTPEQKEMFSRSTILAPQYSIDIGTFQHPTDASEVTRLEGAIVAGVIDVRGRAEINGALITTFEPTAGEGPLVEGGSPANFNTTIGYFGAAAGDAEAEPPGAGWGKILIRFDPDRPLPDGINAPLTLTPSRQTYWEGEP